MTNFNHDHWESLRSRFLEERAAYLEGAHVSENEVKKHYSGEQYFMFDGVRIWMPEHLKNYRNFTRWLKE